MKPIIGVTNLIDTAKNSYWMLPEYLEMIEDLGGIPLIMPVLSDKEDIAQILSQIDGVLLTGGQDIQPSLYRELQLECCGETSLERDECECELIKQAIAKDMPILGICRGVQILNTIHGGTLYQDLATQYHTYVNHHMSAPYNRYVHKVRLDHYLRYLLGEDEIAVNSYHHQAVKDLGKGLEVNATAEDDLIEAIALPSKRFVVGVQWHPEFLYDQDEANRHLVHAFIAKCKK